MTILAWAHPSAAQVISENFDGYSTGDVTCSGAAPGGVMSTSNWSFCFEQTGGTNTCDMTVVSAITGYGGSFPSGSRALRINVNSVDAQVECDLRTGGGDNTHIPGDVWLHAAIYIRSAGTDFSGIDRPMKFWYPCRGSYPCSDNYWLPQLVRLPYNPLTPTTPAGWSADDLLVVTRDNTTGTIDWDGSAVGDESKLGQTSQADWIRADRWNALTMHMDTSTSTCSFDAWIGQVGGALTQVMDWNGGQTVAGSLFNCSVTAGGHSQLSIPSTIPANNVSGMTLDMYLDDIVVSGSVSDLPSYAQPGGGGGGSSGAIRIRIVGAALGWLLVAGVVPWHRWRRERGVSQRGRSWASPGGAN